jgi:Uncharacterized protein conserved in bacteria (DUF2188)
MARVIYRVVPASGDWELTRDQVRQAIYPLKSEAVGQGQSRARAEWEMHARPTQLVVHKSDGTFEYEYTYGDDPFPPPG